MAKIILDGFETKEQAQRFLDWFEGQGEQDDTIPIWLDDESINYVNVDLDIGMIEHPDGWEYKVKIIR